jgi:hypothetical protein
MLELEPVRDIRLTGFFRASDDLVQRVASCAEWEHIETLRIHHQGPHHDPRSNLVLLLESPHLKRLRALDCLMVQFDADARRRFERLDILRNLKQLQLPFLHSYPANAGPWFSDGGAAYASEWRELKSISLPPFLRIDLLHQLTEMPFWNRLETIYLRLPGHERTPEALAILRDRMPESLQELHLRSAMSPDDYTGSDAFFERLAQVPLQRLHLDDVLIRTETLARLLDATNRWDLLELTLSGRTLGDHARILARSPAIKRLLSLDLSRYWELPPSAAQDLLSSDFLHSLVHLDLSGTRIGTEGAIHLANAKDLNRLRSLKLYGEGLNQEGLRALLTSTNLRHLTCLTIEGDDRERPGLHISPDIAAEMTRLPHLAELQITNCHCPSRSRQLLGNSESLAWVRMECDEEYDIQKNRANRAPECYPPIEKDFESSFAASCTFRDYLTVGPNRLDANGLPD